MKSHDEMRAELEAARTKFHLPRVSVWAAGYCHAGRDGDCDAAECPQLRDGEPGRTGRHCPIDIHDEERGYQ